MSRIHDAAQLLVASWLLSGEDVTSSIPSSHGLLDRALQQAVESCAFPEWMRRDLHFTDSRIGLQCVELPSVLDWAQRSELTAAPNPSYQSVQTQISPRVARRLLRQLGISEEDAVVWGKALREGVEKAKNDLLAYSVPIMEEG